MTVAPPLTDDQLVSELWARDVRFLMGRQTTPFPLLDAAHLIASLAQSNDSRIRLSLIPLFLRHPEFASEVKIADELLAHHTARSTLRIFYTAAVFLQRRHWEQVSKMSSRQIQLPDLFSSLLGMAQINEPQQALAQLADRHRAISGRQINWIGTYEHAAEVWLKEMEL
jgi:hypothetical protein